MTICSKNVQIAKTACQIAGKFNEQGWCCFAFLILMKKLELSLQICVGANRNEIFSINCYGIVVRLSSQR